MLRIAGLLSLCIYMAPGCAQPLYRSTYGYDPLGYVTSLTNQQVQGDILISCATQHFNKLGLRTETGDGHTLWHYHYDGLHRLTLAQNRQDQERYTFDLASNPRTVAHNQHRMVRAYNIDNDVLKIIAPQQTTMVTYVPNHLGLIRAIGASQHFAYNLLNQLKTVMNTKGKIIEYNQYGPLKQRLYRDTALGNTLYFYQDHMLFDTMQNGTMSSLLYGQLPIAQLQTGKSPRFLFYNLHGDVVAERQGHAIVVQQYGPYGQVLSTQHIFKMPFGYAHSLKDGATDLQYLGFRYYDPQWQVFLKRDTYSGAIADPTSHNTHVFNEDDPVNGIDATGHMFTRLCGFGQSSVTGACLDQSALGVMYKAWEQYQEEYKGYIADARPFTNGEADSSQLLSMALPYLFDGEEPRTFALFKQRRLRDIGYTNDTHMSDQGMPYFNAEMHDENARTVLLPISDRAQTNGELRGATFRNALDQAKQQNAAQSFGDWLANQMGEVAFKQRGNAAKVRFLANVTEALQEHFYSKGVEMSNQQWQGAKAFLGNVIDWHFMHITHHPEDDNLGVQGIFQLLENTPLS